MTVLDALLRSSLQGALFIGAVWLACRLFPRLPATVRCGLWWAACLKLLVGLVWISPVELPLLPASDSTAAVHRTVSSADEALTSPTLLSSSLLFPSPGEVGREGAGEGPGVRVREGRGLAVVGAVLLWLAGLGATAVKALRQLRFTRRIIARSHPVEDGWVRAAFAGLCARLRLRRQPALRVSAEVRTPQALGLRRPLVMLPEAGLSRLSPGEISMTLCHELVHLRRGDLWLGWVPALAHRIFFFHPLAALAAREYAIAREAACDAEVLRLLGSAPQAYGRLLLRWGVAPRETGLAAAGASPSLQNLKRRLQMLQQTSEKKARPSGWWWLAGAAVLAGLIPLRIVAQPPVAAVEPVDEVAAVSAADPVEAPEPVQAAEPAEPGEPVEAAEPAAPPAPGEAAALADGIPGGVAGGIAGGVEGGVPGGVVGGVAGGVRGGVAGGVAGMAFAPGTPAVAPAPGPVPVARPGLAAPAPRPVAAMAALSPGVPRTPRAPAPRAPGKVKHGYSWGSDDGDSWILLYGKDSTTMHGSFDDLDRVKRLRGSSHEAILWFRRDGREYVIRDAAVLKQAKEIFRPQMELGARQGELGARQGELGSRQGALGAKQGELGARQGALGLQMASLAVSRDGDDADLEKRERALEAQMEELGRQQEALGKQQEALGRQQAVLGEQQAELGRQQGAASEKAQKEFRGLMERAIQSGAAQQIK